MLFHIERPHRTWDPLLDIERHFDALSRRLSAKDLRVARNDAGWELELDAPAVRSEDVQLELDRQTLTIKAVRAKRELAAGERRHLSERRFERIERELELPYEVDVANIEARLANGTLCIKLPRVEREGPRSIAITTG